MANQKRLNEVFEHVTGVPVQQPNDNEIGNTVWTESVISEFLDAMGQDSNKMLDLTTGISNGDWGKVKYSVVNGAVLYLQFQTPEMAHMAFNSLSNSLSNPYEFSSRFDMMPTTVMVQFTDSGIDEGDLLYSHATDTGPNQDQYQIGTEIVPDTLPEGTK